MRFCKKENKGIRFPSKEELFDKIDVAKRELKNLSDKRCIIHTTTNPIYENGHNTRRIKNLHTVAMDFLTDREGAEDLEKVINNWLLTRSAQERSTLELSIHELEIRLADKIYKEN
jgi:hypothetical protein